MSVFRHPKNQKERESDAGLAVDQKGLPVRVKSRGRGGKKAGLPSERDDMTPAAQADRARGKASRTKRRKAKEKERNDLFS